jgi:DNA-binding SARP family transcriptional activator
MQYGVLGPLLVRSQGQVLEVPAAKQRIVLARLLTRPNQLVPSETLAEAVWDGTSPDRATSTLRAYVMRLRHTLGPVAGGRIVTRPPGYLINVGHDELDLLRFDTLCREGRTAVGIGRWQRARSLFAQALALWRGSPLVDVPSQLLCHLEVPRLEQLRLQALEWRIEADLRCGLHGELIAELQVLAAEHPLRERFQAQLMLALYRCNRQGDALAAYHQARRMLIGELGVEPGPELRDLQQRMLTGDLDPAAERSRRAEQIPVGPPSPRQLPAAVRPLAGRQRELARLDALLGHDPGIEDAPPVVSVIVGMAGVGKTALAVHWAHRMAGRFPGGQLHADLQGFGPADCPAGAGEVLGRFLAALGVPPAQVPAELLARAALYRGLLAARRVLVLLDNARDTAQVRPLLPGYPGSLALVTSRRLLTGLAAGEGASLLALDGLGPAGARQMLTARIGPLRAAAEPGAVGELASQCAGLPLALAAVAALAAARPTRPLAALAGELRDVRTRLDLLDTGDPATSVRASFSWSYRLLGGAAARMFRLLAAHPGASASMTAAATIAGCPAIEARLALRELTDAHLLLEGTPGHFTGHELLRAYAASLESSLRAGTHRRCRPARRPPYRRPSCPVQRASW